MYKSLTSVVLLAVMSSSAFSDILYRYKNDVGGTVVDWHVPAEYAGRGYEVLNAQGEVVEVVPRQLSADELQNKDLVERLISFYYCATAALRTLMRRKSVRYVN